MIHHENYAALCPRMADGDLVAASSDSCWSEQAAATCRWCLWTDANNRAGYAAVRTVLRHIHRHLTSEGMDILIDGVLNNPRGELLVALDDLTPAAYRRIPELVLGQILAGARIPVTPAPVGANGQPTLDL